MLMRNTQLLRNNLVKTNRKISFNDNYTDKIKTHSNIDTAMYQLKKSVDKHLQKPDVATTIEINRDLKHLEESVNNIKKLNNININMNTESAMYYGTFIAIMYILIRC